MAKAEILQRIKSQKVVALIRADSPDSLLECARALLAGGLGIIELTMFVLYLVPKTRYLGGLVMLAYLGGAVATHVHAKDGMFFVPVIIGVVAWLGLYFLDRKLRALVPLVTD